MVAVINQDFVVQRFRCESSTFYSYLITYPACNACAIIDPPHPTARCWREINDYLHANGAVLSWILHTTVADTQLEGATAFKLEHVCATSAIGAGSHPDIDCRHFDRLLAHGEPIRLGHGVGRACLPPGANAPQTQYEFDCFQFLGERNEYFARGWSQDSVRLERNCA